MNARPRRSLFLIVPMTLTVLGLTAGLLFSAMGIRFPVLIALAIPNLLLALLILGAILWLGFTISDASRSNRQ